MHDKNVVSQFYFFMWNVWTKDVCLEIYGKVMGEHFWSKFIGYHDAGGFDHAVAKMYADISDHYRDDLVNAAIEYYKNK